MNLLTDNPSIIASVKVFLNNLIRIRLQQKNDFAVWKWYDIIICAQLTFHFILIAAGLFWWFYFAHAYQKPKYFQFVIQNSFNQFAKFNQSPNARIGFSQIYLMKDFRLCDCIGFVFIPHILIAKINIHQHPTYTQFSEWMMLNLDERVLFAWWVFLFYLELKIVSKKCSLLRAWSI